VDAGSGTYNVLGPDISDMDYNTGYYYFYGIIYLWSYHADTWILDDFIRTKMKILTRNEKEKLEMLNTEACNFMGINPADVMKKGRLRDHTNIRKAVYYVFYQVKHIHTSLENTGSYYGQDHATVLYNLRKAGDHYCMESDFKELVDWIRTKYSEHFARIDYLSEILTDKRLFDKNVIMTLLFGL